MILSVDRLRGEFGDPPVRGSAWGYRACRPLFLGLIFGDFLMLGVWTVITAIGGVRGFQLFVT